MTDSAATPRTLVVAAAIRHEGTVLAARRSYPPALAGQWEFPGGKVEPREDPKAALHREILEELGVTIRIGELVPFQADQLDWPITPTLRMRLWWCELQDGDALLRPGLGHDYLTWVGPQELNTLNWLKGDRPILPKLRSSWWPK